MKLYNISRQWVFQISFIVLLLLFEHVNSYKYYPLPSDFCERTNLIQQINFLSRSIRHSVGFNETATTLKFEKQLNSSTYKRFKRDCVINIKTDDFDKNAGIYVNIVKMKLRKDLKTGSCLDHITIKYNNGQTKAMRCGDLKQGQIESIVDMSGEVKITVSIDNQLVWNDNDDYLEFAIVATAFTECRYAGPDVLKCTKESKSCISADYQNDQINQCPYPNCMDENGRCGVGLPPESERVPAPNPSSIALTALTSLLFTMFGVGSCVWIAWNYKDCCGIDPTRRRRNNDPNSGDQTMEMPTSSGPSPSNVAAPLEDKDLPPTYESLFPER